MKVGFGIKDITPRVGVQLYGFGPFLNRVSVGIRERLEARASYFEGDDGGRFLLITCDLCTLQPHTCDTVREIICEKVPSLKPQEIMVECAHTHSGPSTVDGDFGWGNPDAPYMESLPWKIAQAGIDACANPVEGTLSSAVVECRHIGLNRVYDKDAPPLEDVLKPDWEPAHPELTDTVCRVIRFDADSELRGFWVYFGCHPVVCCQLTHYIHGDYPAVAIHKLMAENPGVTGLFLQGAQGDVNSGCVHKPEKESLEALDVFAERFASAIRRGLAAAKPFSDNTVKVVSRKFEFSTRPSFDRAKLLELKAQYESCLHDANVDEEAWETRMNMVYLIGVRKMIENMDAGKKPEITAELQAARIGELEMLGAPFEIMQAIKNDVMAAAKSPQPMVMSLCNGSFGYAPDNTQLQKNSYESYMVAFMLRRQPFANIHNELVQDMLQLDNELNK